MIDAPGTISELDGDYAIVRMEETGCGRCHEEGGCGGNNIGKMFCSSPRIFRVLNPGHSIVGDHVTVVIAEGVIRRSAALAYGMPLLGLIFGALAGSMLGGEVGAIVGSLGGLLCSWLALHIARLNTKPDQRSQPYIRH